MLHARVAHPASVSLGVKNPTGVVETVRAVLEHPDEELDYARSKIAFDRLVDPSIDEQWVLGELDRLTDSARELAGPAPDEAAKLNALRKLVYESGPWNGWRPFAYDMSDPFGRRIRNMLLHNYLATGLGQCVSMPMLFLIIGERIGLDLALATAPDHLFVRYARSDGRTLNLETTSAALPARDVWIREQFPMTDRAIANGLYLRSLTKREGIALMASIAFGPLVKEEHFEEAVALAKVILRNAPRDLHAMLSLASASGQILEQLKLQYPIPWLAPQFVRLFMFGLAATNARLFAAAERMGWVEPPTDASASENNKNKGGLNVCRSQ